MRSEMVARPAPSSSSRLAWVWRTVWSDAPLGRPRRRQIRDTVEDIELGISGVPSALANTRSRSAAWREVVRGARLRTSRRCHKSQSNFEVILHACFSALRLRYRCFLTRSSQFGCIWRAAGRLEAVTSMYCPQSGAAHFFTFR
jgi:hypothetical protein